MVGKIAGTAIRKSIVVLFPPLLLFWDSIPTCSSFFLKFFYVTCFCCFFRGEKRSLQRCAVVNHD